MKKFFFLMFFISLYLVKTSTTGGDIAHDGWKEMWAETYRNARTEQIIDIIEREAEVNVPNNINPVHLEYMYNTVLKLKLPIRIVFRLIYKESNFIYQTNLESGAEGYMQVMPNTRDLYVKRYALDTLNTDKKIINIFVGMHLLKDLYDYWIDSDDNSEKYAWGLTLASYNAGIGTVITYNCVPPIIQTIEFVDFILKNRNGTEQINKIKYNKEIKIEIDENEIEIGT